MIDAPDVLSIWLVDVLVGRLNRTGEGATFALDDDYRRLARRPVLGQVFEDDPARTRFVRQGVPSWFANLLPEGALRDLIAERAGVNRTRSWFLLELLGLDLPGGVIVQREGDAPDLSFSELDEPDGADEQPLKFSLAGVQLKFSALRSERGLTVPAYGRGGDWIVKLPDQRLDGVPEMEYCVMRWAREAGLVVPDVELLDITDIDGLPSQFYEKRGKTFAVKRFDRVEGRRIHIEDFAQVLDLTPGEKYGHANYESIARIIAAVAPQDVDEMVRRLVFQVLSGNGDAHVKNWSLIYPDGVHPRLSPAYDLLNTTAYVANDDLGLRLGRLKAFEEITVSTFRRFATRADLDESAVEAAVLSQVDRTIETWERISSVFDVPNPVREEIGRRLSILPLAVNPRA